MFVKKKTSITFSCTQENRIISQALPPINTSKCYPSWFQKLKPVYKRIEQDYNIEVDSPTVRSCAGIKNTLTNGIILPMWCDLVIDVYPDKSFNYLFSHNNSSGTIHDSKQFGEFAPEYSHLKLQSPWVAEASKPTNFYATAPFYHHHGIVNYTVMPGFLDFYYSHTTNVFILFKHKPEPYRIFIPAGFPLVQYISTSDTFFEIKTKVISKDEWVGKDTRTLTFVKSYSNFVKWFKKNEH